MAMVPTCSVLMFRPLVHAALFMFLVVLPSTSIADNTGTTKPPPCSSEIYCHGDLLHTVQMAGIYKDSKYFVDMKMKRSANETLASFSAFMKSVNNAPNKHQVEKFVNDTFEQPGYEFEDWDPADWTATPKFLQNIEDDELRKKMRNDVRINEQLYSIIYVPHPVIVPGGRFREFYYWDSYWIIKGLLLSEMHNTVKGMLNNFVKIVDKIGFIPNGGRIYYAMRSHPPLLIPMVDEYLKTTHDDAWLKENLWLLEKEFNFWMTNRTVDIEKDGINYTLARYYEESSGPRPESYKEDYLTSQSFRTAEEKDNYYSELKTAAESGWDFSSRWFVHEGTNKGNLTNLKTRSIIPVDLNTFLHRNAILLAQYNRQMGNETKAAYYDDLAEKWKEAIKMVLWHEEVGVWLDYDILNDIKRDYFYPTNILPLWTDCYDTSKRTEYVSKVLKYLEKNQIMLNQGGIPTTLEHSGEQWDYPNAWPPLQYFFIMSLNNTGDPWAQRLAYEISQRWVRSNYKAFNETHSMYEKYDATVSGGHGSGGEYEVQLGFGWSNGLVMSLLDKYGDRLTAEDYFSADVVVENAASTSSVISSAGQMLATLLVIIISLAVGFIGLVMYKRRHYDTPGPSNKRNVLSSGSNLYRKRIAYTELKDMNND
ncbi:Trehalase [Trachymyrmex cornetzi]|uniref:Trehalase n=1 Tax=Trachymyrmex cornetzi TaxID=471704 RepID=A0A195DS33_9HYME|nr:Trehalase [Trachymyrmex cornetzi]